MLTYEQRLDMITTHAWEAWTNNGLGLDAEDREETTKSVRDAATNTYADGISDTHWLADTLQRLRA